VILPGDPPTQLESTWTSPRDHCPHPERWHSTDSDSTEAEVTALVAAFVTALQPDYVVETGTNIGHTAYAIGRALQESGRGRLVTCETDPNFVEVARRRCEGLPVEVHHGSSLDWIPDQPIDFAFFDSLVQIRADELLRYLPTMHANTVVGFHDTGPHHPVMSYLEPLVAQRVLEPLLLLPTPRGVGFARLGPNADAVAVRLV
jgi:hypothetical protein